MPKHISINSDDQQEIVRLYESGVKGPEIARRFGLHRTTIPKLYKRIKGITTKLTPSQGNVHYFQTIDTHLKAYFLGFIAADGCIVENRSNSGHADTLSINIKSCDRQVLDKLKEELNSELAIHYFKDKDQVGFRLCNQQICDDLRKYGLDYRKSLTMGNIIPLIPEEFRSSFILGYHDGDGCMHWKKSTYISNKGYTKIYFSPSIQICGTKEFLLGLVDHLKPSGYFLGFHKSIHTLNICRAADVKLFMETVYKNCNFYLKRKYDKYYEVHQDQTISSSDNSELGARVPIIA